MATKTISLELDAYEKLRSAKRPGESFSEVVRRAILPESTVTGKQLLAYLKQRGAIFTDHALDELEQMHEKLSAIPDNPWKENE